MKKLAILLVSIALLALPFEAAQADEVRAAVAANFTAVIKKLTPVFERKTGHKLVVSFGATGKLYAQIRNGAPVDVFLSADDLTPQKLVAEGDAVGASCFIYARGRLALWSCQPGYVDAQGAILKSDKFTKIAIANPKTAPYGQAAIDALTTLKLLDTILPRFVIGENVAQTQQFISSGNVPLGFIALAQVKALAHPARDGLLRVNADAVRFFESVEAKNGSDTRLQNLAASGLATGFRLPGIAGSDCHTASEVGRAATKFSVPVADNESLLAALRAGAYESTYID